MPTPNDFSFGRDERRAAARAATGEVGEVSETEEERYARLRVEFGLARPARSLAPKNALPTTAAGPMPRLIGAHDIVYPVHSTDAHVVGEGNDWLLLSSFPQQLRAGGWVYLKSGRRVTARARVRSIGFREDAVRHTPNDGTGELEHISATPTLELDPESWELGDAPCAATHQRGFRYVSTDDDAGTITHLVKGEPSSTVEWVRSDAAQQSTD